MVYIITKSGGFDLNDLSDVTIVAVYDSFEKAVSHIERITKDEFDRTSPHSWYKHTPACPAYGWVWCSYEIEPMEVQ
jgi:hypothetical protein